MSLATPLNYVLGPNDQIAVSVYGVQEYSGELTVSPEGNVSIPMFINEVIDEDTKEITSREVNPDFVSFQNDFNALLSEERELEYHAFKLEEFDSVETDGVYSTFFKLIKVVEDNA
jgi:hypothetical protein